MLKDILNLEDIQALNKNQQQSINGSGQGFHTLCCDPTYSCCNSGDHDPCQYVFGTTDCI